MRPAQDLLPATLGRSLLAALTTFVTLLSWSGFAEQPSGFLVPLFLACLLVALVGAVLRAARLPVVVVAAGQLVVLALWLQHRLGGHEALLGWLPTTDSVRAVGSALHASGVAAQSYPSPVPATAPEFYPLLVVTGAATAVLVDLLALGLRRAPLSGLPLLAAYTAPVSILDGGVSWVTFAAAALCFLFLLAADHGHRLEHWGHRLSPARGPFDVSRDGVSTGGVWSSARKIGFTATGLAVVAPLLLPTFHAHLFDGPGTGTGAGDGGVSLSNPIVDLKRDLVRGADVPLVTVSTDDPDPSYLRLTVLNSFDGAAWRPATREIPRSQRADGETVTPPGLLRGVARTAHTATVHVDRSFASRWLPTPYPVTSVDAPGDWRYDSTTLDFLSATDGQTAAGLSYRLRSLELRPTATQLDEAPAAPASVFSSDTALPRSFPASIRRLADRVTAGRTSTFERAVALQDWFRVSGGFRYSLARPSGTGTDDLVGFLGRGKDGRVGYCEQFAAAMAAMGRSLGIPSRVAVGFLSPQRDARPHTWTYSSHDLHAWPEMYFDGVGWVRFEPTPQTRTGAVPAYTRTELPQATRSSSAGAPAAVPSATAPTRRPDLQRTVGAATSSPTDRSRVGQLVLLAALLVLAGSLVPRVLRVRRSHRRWAAAGDPRDWAEAGWQELRDTYVDLGRAWDRRWTVRGAARRVAASFGDPGRPAADTGTDTGTRGGTAASAPEAVAALHRLTGLVERARYARSLPEDAATGDTVRRDVAACVAALRAGAPRRDRIRAWWVPASVLRDPARDGGRASGLTGLRSTTVDRAV